MNREKTQTLFQTFYKIKTQVALGKSWFQKPRCLCLTTQPRHVQFWGVSDLALSRADDLASLAVRLIGESQQCLCLERTLSLLDKIYVLLQPFLITLGHQWDSYHTNPAALVENQSLNGYFQAFAKSALNRMDDVTGILQGCDMGHYSLLAQYDSCIMHDE